MIGSNLYIGLVHHPVYDKRGKVVAAAVTNLDVHDIARCARTYSLGGFFVITPLESQAELAKRIIWHWVEGAGSSYNPTRKEPLSLVEVIQSIDEADRKLSRLYGKNAKRIATGASAHPGNIGFELLKGLIEDRKTPFLILFGTGWGLTQEVKESSDYVLAPIRGEREAGEIGGTRYNHLSVRSAVAIILDRLLGDRTA